MQNIVAGDPQAYSKQQSFLQRDLKVKDKTESHETDKQVGQSGSVTLSTRFRNAES